MRHAPLLVGRRLMRLVHVLDHPSLVLFQFGPDVFCMRAQRFDAHILPDGQRQAVVLFHLMGMTHMETAAALGIQVGAVKTRLHKASVSLRRALWTLWEEMQAMSSTATPQDTASDYVDVEVVDVRRIVPNEKFTLARNVALLQETSDQQRILGIWIGSLEGEAILVLLSGVEVPRPLTFNFAINLLEAAGGSLREVRVNKLVDKTFFAETIVAGPDGTVRVVDARPSDAIALALTRSAPIRVAEEVMREAAWATSAAVDADVPVDGNRVLGKSDILRLMGEQRVQRETELQKMGAEFDRRRASKSVLPHRPQMSRPILPGTTYARAAAPDQSHSPSMTP